MKKTIFYSVLVIVAIATSVFIFQPKPKEAPPVVAQVEIAKPSTSQKVSILASDNSRGYYGDALEQAFEKAQLDDPKLAAKVAEWKTLRNELHTQASQYSEVVDYYHRFTEAAERNIKMLNDSTQRTIYQAELVSLHQNAEFKLAVKRLDEIAQIGAQMDDYLIQLKISSTIGYMDKAVTYASDEAEQFEAMTAKAQAFIAN